MDGRLTLIPSFRDLSRNPATAMAGANVTFVLLNLVQGLLLARILGPEKYGIWLGLVLLFQYGQYTYLGATTSVFRQIPLQRGRQDAARAEQLTSAAHGLVLLTNFGWALIGAVLAFTVYRDVWFGALALVALTVMEIWINLGETELKASERFHTASAIVITRGVLLVALLPLVAWIGLEGAYLRWFLIALVLLAIIAMRNPVPRRFRFDREAFGDLIHDGGPILLVGVIFAFQIHLDRTLLLLLSDEASLGQYGVAAILMSVMMAIPKAVGQTAYPAMVEEFGRTGRTDGLWGATLRRTARVGAVAVVAAGAGVIALPYFVEWVLPAFVPGIDAARAILPGTAFVAASVPASIFLQTIGRQGLHARTNLVALVVQALLGVAALRMDTGIVGLATAMSIAFGCYFGLLLWTASRARHRPRPEAPTT